MNVLNVGSLNIDCVYRVPHIVAPGETLASSAFSLSAGGKGANQSVALAKAGMDVSHAGRVGTDGAWLVEKLDRAAVDTEWIRVDPEGKTGHALIQVDDQGENAIILFPGTNQQLDLEELNAALSQAPRKDIGAVLLQNETNGVGHIIEQAHRQGLRVCFNPAPASGELRDLPLECVDVLILNRIEGQCLAGGGADADDAILRELAARMPDAEIVLTLGAEGALHAKEGRVTRAGAVTVDAVDTTAAGDTFVGYFLAERLNGGSPEDALQAACRAAAACVTRQGAMDTIPHHNDIQPGEATS